jgi:hypothetical protein
VSGAYTPPPGATDAFLDTLLNYKETEAGLDYSASAICAFAGYAALPSDAFDHCEGTSRSPFEGRG